MNKTKKVPRAAENPTEGRYKKCSALTIVEKGMIFDTGIRVIKNHNIPNRYSLRICLTFMAEKNMSRKIERDNNTSGAKKEEGVLTT